MLDLNCGIDLDATISPLGNTQLKGGSQLENNEKTEYIGDSLTNGIMGCPGGLGV